MKPKNLTLSILLKSIILTLILLLTGQATALQAAGEDDDLLVPGFGAGFNGQGYVELDDRGAVADAVAVQPGGKIVIGGMKNNNFWLTRYTADGKVDTNFGQNGEVITAFTSQSDRIFDIAITQPFGEIVAVGHAGPEMAIAKYTTDGVPIFQKSLNFVDDETEKARSVAIQPDGRIVVGGSVGGCRQFTCTDHEFAYARLFPDGVPDRSFDNDGKRMDDLGTVHDSVTTILAQDDGKIVAIGIQANSFGGETRPGLVRLEPTGRLDSTLDDDGKLSGPPIGYGVDGLVQADGKIVVVTKLGKMIRFNANGSVDAGFGPNGLVELATSQASFAAINLKVQIEFGANGSFLVAGRLESGEVVVVRYSPQGILDTSFNAGQGYAELPSTHPLEDMAMAPDGSILILQNSTLTRLLPNGALDSGDGRVVANLTDLNDELHDILIQPDGKIVVVGQQGAMIGNRPGGLMSVARYFHHGFLDSSFGNRGFITEPAHFSIGRATALDAQNRILVAGAIRTAASGTNFDFTLRRYASDGTPVHFPAAAGGEWPVTDIVPGQSDDVSDMVVQPDGKIVLAGRTGFNNPPADFVLVRYLDNGALDTSFGTGGKVITDIDGRGSKDFLRAVALQPDGKLLASGFTRPQGADEASPILVRYLPNGELDPDFGGGDGIAPSQVSQALALQPDGRIVVGGTVEIAGRRQIVVARYTSTGAPDHTFNGSGMTVADFGQDAIMLDLILEPNGTVVVAGCVQDDIDPFMLARFLTTGPPDPSFSSDGKATIDISSVRNACATGIARDPIRGSYVLAGSSEARIADRQFALMRVKGELVRNDRPAAAPNAYSTAAGTPLTIDAPGVLDNDNDPEGLPLNALLTTAPENGGLTLNTDGSFSYTPKPDFSGVDRFTYWASDGFNVSDPATVTVEVGATDPTPTPDPNPNPGNEFTIFLPLVVK